MSEIEVTGQPSAYAFTYLIYLIGDYEYAKRLRASEAARAASEREIGRQIHALREERLAALAQQESA